VPFQIIRNDITKVKADAIVNTANPKPRIGRGTDSAIYEAAGEEQLLIAREKIGEIAPGQAACTDAFNLNARYVIHTVGPKWIDGSHGERDVLHSCYEKSLALADELHCRSIAFPLIASGTYGFPKDEALHIALTEIQKFLLTHEMKVILVVFDRKAMELSEGLVGGIEQFIDDHAVSELRARERRQGSEELYRRRPFREEETLLLESIAFAPEPWDEAKEDILPPAAVGSPMPDIAGKSLDEVLGSAEESFQQRLLELIDESGMDDVAVYKKANIDRKVFSRIRCKPDYKPKKKTAVAFAIALELDLPTMTDLLARAEIALSPNNRFDLIITYFVSKRIYDIYEINAALFKYGQPILGE
jgi:O-acetyl-ADP-ribose deacetylase (regulator of RNase III)